MSAHPSAPVPLVRIRSASGPAALDLTELWRFRDLLFVLAGRDIRVRYKQTLLGSTWVVLQPLLTAGIFSFVFGTVANLPSDGIPYFIFAYSGLLAWNAFNGTASKASGALVGNAHLVGKVYFPRLILPLSTMGSTLVDFAVSAALLAVLLPVYGIAFHAGLLLLPLWLALMLVLALGIGLMAGSLAVRYRDVGRVLGVFLGLLLFVSPVSYAASAVPERFRAVYSLNPLVGYIDTFRWSLLGTGSLDWRALAYSVLVSVVVLAAGLALFKRLERGFADVI